MIEVLAITHTETKYDVYCDADFVGTHKLEGGLLEFVQTNPHKFPQFEDAWACAPRNGAKLVRLE